MSESLTRIYDPIVIDPPDINSSKQWALHQAHYRAAFDADPGCCSCPNCNTYYWAFGKWQCCKHCGMEFPTDAWAMYLYGVQERHRRDRGVPPFRSYERDCHHPYYQYGFDHPVEGSIWDAYHAVNWLEVMGLKSWWATYDPRKE